MRNHPRKEDFGFHFAGLGKLMKLVILIFSKLLLSIAALSGQPLPQHRAHAPVTHRPVGTPFTATMVTRKYGPDGNVAGQELITYSVQSDKSTSKSIRRFTADGKMVVNTTLLHDLRRNFEIVVEHFTRSTHHGVLPIRDDDNLNTSDIASRATDSSILLGYPVFKIETVRSSPDEGEIVQENWIAPELDNFPLWTTTTWKLGEMTLRSETEATSIVPAALPQEAFQVPEGYVERTPSEQAKLLMDRLGWPQTPSSQTSEWDRRYFERLPETMKSLVRSRRAVDPSRLPGALGEDDPASTRETLVARGEDLEAGPSGATWGSGLDRTRILVLVACLIVGAAALLMVRRNYLRSHEPPGYEP